MSSQKVDQPAPAPALATDDKASHPRRASLRGRRVSINETVRMVSFGFQQPVVRPATSRRRSISLWSDTSDQEFVDRGEAKEDEGDRAGAGAGEEYQPQHSILKQRKPPSRFQTFVDNLGYSRLRSKYFGSSRQVAKSWRKIMLLYETIYEELQFPIFSEKAGSLNHLSGQLWLLTFSLKDFKPEITEQATANAKNADIAKLNELYAKLVYEAVLTEELVQALLAPLKALTEAGTTRLGEMKRVIFGSEEDGAGTPASRALAFLDIDIETSTNRRLSTMMMNNNDADEVRLKSQNVTIPKSVRESLLRGSRIQPDFVFDRLAIYTRTTAKRKWDLLNSLPYERRLQLMTEALVAVTTSLVKLRRLLKPVLRFLTSHTSHRCSLLRSSVVAALDSMSKALRAISGISAPPSTESAGGLHKYAEFLAVDEPKVITVLRRTESYVYAIVNTGKFAVTQIMEVMAMAQLCYIYLVEGLELPLRPCEDVVKQLVKNYQPKAFFKDNQFQAGNFFMTRYPDVLRKVPVIVHRAELSLHKCSDQSLLSVIAAREKKSGQAGAAIAAASTKDS